jgi:hypothetical protein
MEPGSAVVVHHRHHVDDTAEGVTHEGFGCGGADARRPSVASVTPGSGVDGDGARYRACSTLTDARNPGRPPEWPRPTVDARSPLAGSPSLLSITRPCLKRLTPEFSGAGHRVRCNAWLASVYQISGTYGRRVRWLDQPSVRPQGP